MTDSKKLKEQLKNGDYRELLLDIYVDDSRVEYQTNRYIHAIENYENIYGKGEINIFSAPGRSEVGGNHTDHQHGEILAAAINLDAIAIAAATEDGVVSIVSEGMDPISIRTDSLEIVENEKESTAALVRGVLRGCVDRGYSVGGFKAYITSDVLIGAGLSSSAAFEILIGTVISHMYNDGNIDAVTIAVIGQFAENVYFGKPCGLMDQMACSVGNMVHVDFANQEKPVVEKVVFDMNKYGYSLCITNTKGSHADLTSEYAAIPQEMKNVASYFGREVLLGLTNEDIIQNIVALRTKYGDRAVLRALHFINENERVKQEVAALKSEDTDSFMLLVKASGDSSFKYLQNVYSPQDITRQNLSIALAVSDAVLAQGNGVSRVHGGGLAGTVQAFVRNEKAGEYITAMNKVFGDKACEILKIRKYGGMRVF